MLQPGYSTPVVQSSEVHSCQRPSKTRKMPLVRPRRPLMNISSSPVNTVDAEGTAYLCFPEDHSWFQGNISTDDESNYSLYGERISVAPEDKTADKIAEGLKNLKVEENNNSPQADAEKSNDKICEGSADNSGSSTPSEEEFETDYYRVTMIDHFSGQKYKLPRIIAKMQDTTSTSASSPGHLFTSLMGEVTFQVEKVYKGQKADLMIHRYLGAPSLVGKKCLLYSGQINILFNDIGETERSWSL